MRERRTTTADIKKEHACRKNNWKCQVYSLLLLLCIMKLIEFFSFLLSILLFLFFRSIARAHTNQPTNKQKKRSSALIHFNESFLCIFCRWWCLPLLIIVKDNGCRAAREQRKNSNSFLFAASRMMMMTYILLPEKV